MDSEPGGVQRLSPQVVASLREAFAGEVATRLPRMLAAGGRPSAQVLSDAHSLGSSAHVVGEGRAALAAREVERRAERGEAVGDEVAALHSLLAGWLP